MAQHRVQQWATFARMWYIYDAKWQCPFKTAPLLVKYLQGKNKPIYHPLSDVGDHVVVINTKEIAMKNDYWRQWKYYHHTGYAGGFSVTRAYLAHEKDPTRVLFQAVKDYTKNNLSRKPMLARLHLYPDENVPEDILKNINGQIRQVMPIPKRLDEYTEEEREQFIQLFEWPMDYVPQERKLGTKKAKDFAKFTRVVKYKRSKERW